MCCGSNFEIILKRVIIIHIASKSELKSQKGRVGKRTLLIKYKAEEKKKLFMYLHAQDTYRNDPTHTYIRYWY